MRLGKNGPKRRFSLRFCASLHTDASGLPFIAAGNVPAGSALGNIKLAISASSPQVLYASVAAPTILTNIFNMQNVPLCAGVYEWLKTTDGGNTWSVLTNVPNYLIAQGQFTSALAVDPSDPDIVYAGGTALGWGQPSGMMVSLDGGNTWYALDSGWTDGAGIHGDCHAMAFDADGRLLLGDDGGIWRLDSNTADWDGLSSDLNTIQFDGVALDPTNAYVFYGGAQDNGTIKFGNAPQGVEVLGGDGGYVRADPTQPGTVYTEQSGLNLFRSDDAGATWASKLNGVSADNSYFYVPYVLDPAHPARLVMGTDKIYETRDRGEDWTPLSFPGLSGWSTNEVITALALAPTDTNTIYAAAGGEIFATFDHGNTWQPRDINGGPAGWIQGLAVDPADNLIAYAVRAMMGSGHVFYTTNGGADWLLFPEQPSRCGEVCQTVLDTGSWSAELPQRDERDGARTVHSRCRLVRDAPGKPQNVLVPMPPDALQALLLASVWLNLTPRPAGWRSSTRRFSF